MSDRPVIVWFRQDLRLADNPALRAAYDNDRKILPLYILDDDNAGEWAMGEASRWWLHESLKSLNADLDGRLCFAKGDASKILPEIIEEVDADSVYWNRCYEPWRITRDKRIKSGLGDDGIEVKSFKGSLLFEPHEAVKDDGDPYKVFTPFYKRGCLQNAPEPRETLPRPQKLDLVSHEILTLDALGLLPDKDWYESIDAEWEPGESGARARFREFLDEGLKGYKDGRNHPAQAHVSRLSPHLHYGEISPYEIWHEVQPRMVAENCEKDGEHFLSEIGWREFSNNLLYHFPELPRENLQKKFDAFPWRDDNEALERWKRGQTGYPIVDAGMRELWQTGYMHNRVRMIVGSFLVKNLLLHWHHGEDWFWDTLIDADLANNSASWQWIAGCGADAAPYFRIFNPVTQGQKFDKDGEYVRKYVPEIADLPDKYLHAPWEAKDDILASASVKLGEDYPEPIVDLKASRERALQAFQNISG